MNLAELYQQAVKHKSEHKCSAVPYEHAEKLVQAIEQFQPTSILEIGTGIGYSAAVMALACFELGLNSEIDTLEKDREHALLAEEFIKNNQADHLVKILNVVSEEFLPKLQKNYDFIFFDGFQIHYEFLPQYERLLKKDGILFLANKHLKSKTSERFFYDLEHDGKWEILEHFSDTTIAKRI